MHIDDHCSGDAARRTTAAVASMGLGSSAPQAPCRRGRRGPARGDGLQLSGALDEHAAGIEAQQGGDGAWGGVTEP
jgi:hypothetical protein